jgi:type III restriction enzyme
VLEKEDLEKDFKLADKDIQINFDLVESSIFEIDLSKDDNLPKYKKASQMQREYFKQYLKTVSDETRIRQSINLIFDKLRKDNVLNENDLKNYIERIVNNLSDERKARLLDEIDAYTIKIKNKIKELKSEYREKVFYDLLNKGNIKIENTFSFEPTIQSSKLSSLRDKSLYEEEIDNLNSLENRLLTEIVSLDNIKWWHRNKDMKPGFCMNGFINHYPDFIICTENENIIMVEVKGDDRTNDDSKIKLKLGSKWADKAGDKYSYFMVFEKSKIEGSLLVDEFISTIRDL